MEPTHYLLQNAMLWWHNIQVVLASGGAQLLYDFEQNARQNPARDAGNIATATGGGWAATRDAFTNLWGVTPPAQPAATGEQAVTNTVSDFVIQALDYVISHTAGGASPAPSGNPNYSPANLADVLPPEMGGKPNP